MRRVPLAAKKTRIQARIALWAAGVDRFGDGRENADLIGICPQRSKGYVSLNGSFKAAEEKIATLNADERKNLLSICRKIRGAQTALTRKSAPILAHCLVKCQGLCCRNLHSGDIITEWDLIYIRTLAPELREAMVAGLGRESFFASDCLFLKNGLGPCLFPESLRPERCVISFCRVEPSIEKEIGRVMGEFSRLVRFFWFRPFRRLGSRALRVLCK